MEDGSLPPDYAFNQIQMRSNGQQEQRHPHSHHGTPAHEYAGFTWSPSSTRDVAMFEQGLPQRPSHQSLHPLVMPQWPSMLSSQPAQANPYYPTVLPQGPSSTTSSTPQMTPLSATSNRSGSTPRRTLTDEERRDMCHYHEQNPSAKQNEIGGEWEVR